MLSKTLVRLGLAVTLSFEFVQTLAAASPWLSEMPAPSRVYEKIQGTDEFDTAARRYAAFHQLSSIMQDMIGLRLLRNQATAQERELLKQYSNEVQSIQRTLLESLSQAGQSGQQSRRAAWFNLAWKYQHDLQLKQELLKAFFSADFQRELAQVVEQRKLVAQAEPKPPARPMPPVTTGAPFPQDPRTFGGMEGAPHSSWFMNGWLWLLAGALLVAAVVAAKLRKPRFRSEKQLETDAASATRAWLRSLGATHVERAARIATLFDERSATISVRHFASTTQYSKGGPKEGRKTYLFAEVERSLASMDDREREYLRIATLLNSAADGSNPTYRGWCAALLLGDGKGKTGSCQWQGVDGNSGADSVLLAATALGLKVEPTINEIVPHLASLRGNASVGEDIRGLASESIEALTGRGGWLRRADVPGSVFAPKGPFEIRLGSFADGSPLAYSGSGALMTIAAPGSGKSQCHAIPNLLRWKGAAVVLDLKGELYQATSRWRAENVGPVYRFAPTQPNRSHRYNPLAFVDEHPERIWQESRFLADMMIVPSGSKESSFWDGKAKEVVAAGIASICHALPPEERSMARLMDIIHGGKAFEEMVGRLKAAVDVPAMMRAGTSLAEMNEKTRADVLATVQTSFHGWGDAPVERTTSGCDWSPLDLRQQADRPPTLYICLTPREVEGYLSIMRVVLAQHIRMLTAEAPAESDRSRIQPVLFLLDELPRLREMPPVAEAIEIGASFGLRVWMFAQSLGQMQNAYKNADGMIGSCAVRAYMNPSGADGLAEKLSEELGYTVSLQDGSRKRLVEAAELAGPSYKDLQLVFGQGARPAQLRKDFAWQNTELAACMGAAEVVRKT